MKEETVTKTGAWTWDTGGGNPADPSHSRQPFPMERFLKELEQIINMDSGTSDVAGCHRVAAFFERRLREAGLSVVNLPYGADRRPMVIATSPGAAPAISGSESSAPAAAGPLAAAETTARKADPRKTDPRKGDVPEAAMLEAAMLEPAPHGEGMAKDYDFLLVGHMDTVFPAGTAARRPFRLDAAAGRAYGPGTVDMKAGALLMVYIAQYLAQHVPNLPLCLVLNSDEETGSPDAAPLLAALGNRARRAFVFEGGRKQGQFVHQRKGCSKYEIQVHGVASHAGTAPQQGASAIVEAAHLVLQLDRLKRYDRGTSVNVGRIEGGTALNVVADSCSLKAEVRYTDEGERRRIERALSKLQASPYVAGASISIDLLSAVPPLRLTPATEALMEQMVAYGREPSSGDRPPVAFVSAGGLSDANRLAVCGIPIIDGCGPGGGFPHSEKEFLSLETVPDRFWFLTGVMAYIHRVQGRR